MAKCGIFTTSSRKLARLAIETGSRITALRVAVISYNMLNKSMRKFVYCLAQHGNNVV